MRRRWWLVPAAVVSLGFAAPAALEAQPKPVPTLNYDFFKNRVEPIFLKKNPGHTRCVVCHSESNNMFKLQPLSPGATAWTEDQSRLNFEMVKNIIVPGDPENSRLTKHPLAPEAGGDPFHSGGRQFASKNDADWKVLLQFVNGAK